MSAVRTVKARYKMTARCDGLPITFEAKDHGLVRHDGKDWWETVFVINGDEHPARVLAGPKNHHQPGFFCGDERAHLDMLGIDVETLKVEEMPL